MNLAAMSLAVLVGGSYAADNGLALTPPMGWRSWNLFGRDVSQNLIEKIMDGMVSRERSVDGVPTSLCDLGYCDVGLDDNWQACGQGTNTEFHDAQGNPIVNTTLFPDMAAMTSYAHKLNLTAGWYGNNCICAERKTNSSMYYKGDVAALIKYGFDAVKLDGCGAQTDLEQWYDLMNATGKPITIENCHWGSKYPFEPTKDWCPWHFYRTSSDVRAQYSSILHNLQTTIKYAQTGLSRPGCWAYPDMLEVGCAHGPGGASDPGLTPEETRSHFGAWAIVSSPLTLSHDVNNATIMDSIWPVIANKEVIAINQAWDGHSGSPFSSDLGNSQYFYKPVGNDQIAVLLMNQQNNTQDLLMKFADVPGIKCGTTSPCHVRDVWNHKELGTYTGTFLASALRAHDASFLIIRNN